MLKRSQVDSNIIILLIVSFISKSIFFILGAESSQTGFHLPISEAWQDYSYAYVPTIQDTESKFEKMFDKFYNLLNDESVIPASHLAINSGKIARAKLQLQTKITDKLLNIDNTNHSQEHKELIKGYIIEGFSEYFEESKDKEKIIEFVRKQLKSKSPRTRRQAEQFLRKFY